MVAAGYIIFLAINNRLRGSSFYNKIISLLTSKAFTSLYAGIAIYLISNDYILGLITFFGLWLWALLGWGKYFAAFHGRYYLKEKEFLPADLLGDWVFKQTSNDYLAGTVGMVVRGLMILPMFIGFSAYLSNPMAVVNGIACAFLQGYVYWLMKFIPEKHALFVAEVLMGGVIGLFILFSTNNFIL